MSVSVSEISNAKLLVSKPVLIAAGGAGAGGLTGEYLAEMAKTSLAQTGWKGVGVKAIVKALLALLVGVLSRGQAGLTKIFLALAGIGSLGSILPDVIRMVSPGGAEAAGQIAGLKLRQLTMGAKALGTQTTTKTTKGVGDLTGKTPPTVDFVGNGNGALAASALAPMRAAVTDFTGT